MDFNLQTFYQERDKRIQMLDEDLNEYQQRMLSLIPVQNTVTQVQAQLGFTPEQEQEQETTVTQDIKQHLPTFISTSTSFTSLETTHLGNSSEPGPSSIIHTEFESTMAMAPDSEESSRAKYFGSSHSQLGVEDNGYVNEDINPTTIKKNVDEILVSHDTSPGTSENIKRKEPPTRNFTPTKRQKNAKDINIEIDVDVDVNVNVNADTDTPPIPSWNNSSIYAISTPLPFPFPLPQQKQISQSQYDTQMKHQRLIKSHDGEEKEEVGTSASASASTSVTIEQPSEIKSFTPSPVSRIRNPRRKGQQDHNVTQNSPISDFSSILTYPPPGNSIPKSRLESNKNGLRIETGKGKVVNWKGKLNVIVPGGGVTRTSLDDHDHEGDNDNDTSTSPIEDPSVQNIDIDIQIQQQQQQQQQQAIEKERSIPRKAIVPAGSSLYLEVKERVARHVAMKRHDKVIPIGSKSMVEKDVVGDVVDGNKKEGSRSTSTSTITVNPKERQVDKGKDMDKGKSKGNNTRVPNKPPPPTKQPRKSQSNKKEKVKEKDKEKESPQEYAQFLMDQAKTNPKPKGSFVQFLEGTRIFYTGGDMCYAGERTKARMEMILKYGGEVVPTFNPNIVTHIITDASKVATLRALGLKRLNEIPNHIPTLSWNWILSAYGRTTRFSKEEIQEKMDAEDLWLNATFVERIDVIGNRIRNVKSDLVGSRKDEKVEISGLGNGVSESSEDLPTPAAPLAGITGSGSHNQVVSSFSGLLPSPPTESSVKKVETSNTNNKPSNMNDPLADFYAQAKVARDLSWSRLGEGDETDDEFEDMNENPPLSVVPTTKRGWTCDKKDPQLNTCINQDIIDRLQELQELHKAKLGDEDHWRAFSYNKSIRAIRAYPKRIKSFSEARSIRGVGEKTALKIMEILETGDLKRIQYERTNDVEVTRLFQGIYGVGQMTAFKWYSAGCRTLDDLRNEKGGVRLNPAQLIGLQYYEDINSRMPRDEAKAIFDLIKAIALSLDNKLFVEIMGSYRRGKADCGDIDILITRPTDDGCTHAGIIGRLLPELRASNILTDDLAIPEDVNDLECVYRGLCHLPNQENSRRRRIDFLTVPWKNRGGALLYYTGDDIFNRAMRLKANRMGYSLNQRGLSSGVVRDPKDFRVKLNEGTIIASETEEEIFKILNVPWQEPEERVRG